jgi:DNA-binding response OmpR family regulator
VLSGAVALFATGRVWLRYNEPRNGLADLPATATGHATAGAAGTLALVVLAGVVVLPASRGIGRRVAGGLIALAGLGIGYLAVATIAFTTDQLDISQASTYTDGRATAWPWIALVCGVVAVGPRWVAAMSPPARQSVGWLPRRRSGTASTKATTQPLKGALTPLEQFLNTALRRRCRRYGRRCCSSVAIRRLAMTESTAPAGDGPAKGLVLVIEDERAIADLERMYLTREGFGVHVESDGRAGLAAARNLHPVAIVLDVGIPTIDGTEICRILRADGDWTPILFVTARDDEVDRILGLELGADDYLTKPFSPRELVARVKAVLRRSSTDAGSQQRVYVVGRVTVDPARRRVNADGQPVDLTATEFELLEFLCRRPGRVFPREHLLSEVWGYAAAAGTRTVDVHVAQLRAKLGDASPIRTVRGVGYSADV